MRRGDNGAVTLTVGGAHAAARVTTTMATRRIGMVRWSLTGAAEGMQKTPLEPSPGRPRKLRPPRAAAGYAVWS